LWGVRPKDADPWNSLKERIGKQGLRHSRLLAIAPTATIASIVGAYECIEPQISNLFKRETLSGEFLQINRYLVDKLKELGLWTEQIRNRIKQAEGSIHNIREIPDSIKTLFRGLSRHLVYRLPW
jgi:ribonucleoside-diphosphate reductase alpha chain